MNFFDALSYRVDKVILGGDFNAKASLWGFRLTNKKGTLLIKWTVEKDLRIVNVGNKPTCVRPQGSSIVDLTWASPDLVPYIRNWQVEEEVESLSDHLYITFSIHSGGFSTPINRSLSRMWSYKDLNRDFFYAVLYWRGLGPPADISNNTSSMTERID